MANEKTKTEWTTLDLTKAKGDMAKTFKAYTDSRAATTKLREDFETAVGIELAKQKLVPEGMEPRFSHKFGVAVTFVPKTEAKGKTKTLSL